ncbi:hypothetical protein CDL15_Pgr012824 [Punica granatum]|uniref:Uncharacterized protein n=1 Tax=Punica granatum TaxID=22663 RepID=A0A218XEI0_PUNGR|nr:hypothetical protein CDL15_Pgr012824 [Punica granatum]
MASLVLAKEECEYNKCLHNRFKRFGDCFSYAMPRLVGVQLDFRIPGCKPKTVPWLEVESRVYYGEKSRGS